jgi:type IV secretory pathway VirB10-like protein
MADSEPTPTPIIDHTAAPKGVIPKNARAYLMGAAIIGIALLVFIGGSKPPTPKSENGSTKSTPSSSMTAESLANYVKQFRGQDDRDKAAQAVTERLGGRQTPALDSQPSTGGERQPDPIAEERRRREYDSLFASNVVSRKNGSQSGDMGRRGAAGGERERMPTLEETAAAVIRASSQATPNGGATTLPGLPPTTRLTGEIPPGRDGATGSAAIRTPPIDAAGPLHRILEGTYIDATLTNRLDGGSAAPVNALVTNPVYSYRGDYVLIPAGARVLGETKPVQNFGETRLAIAFHRLLLPDGSTVSLEKFKGLNQIGTNGLKDQVDHHYLSTFGASAAVGLISGLSQAVGTRGISGDGNNRTVVVAGDVGNSTTQASSQVMSKFLNRLPTITIREGVRLKVYVTSDIELPAYSTEKGHER